MDLAENIRNMIFFGEQHIKIRRKAMTLRDFLYENHMTMDEFAKRILYTPCYVSQVIRGVMKPGKMFEYLVEKHTKGLVKAHEISDTSKKKAVKNLVM